MATPAGWSSIFHQGDQWSGPSHFPTSGGCQGPIPKQPSVQEGPTALRLSGLTSICQIPYLRPCRSLGPRQDTSLLRNRF